MGITPWDKGDEKPSWDFELEPDTGVFDITGLLPSDFTLELVNTSNHQTTIGTGTFSNIQAASGGNPASIQYQQSANDVGTPGTFDMRVVVKIGTAEQQTFKFGIWECIA